MQEQARLITFPPTPIRSATSTLACDDSKSQTSDSLKTWLDLPSNSLTATNVAIVLALLVRLDTLNRKNPTLADRALNAVDYILRMLGV